jgi:hypothetical protein
LRASRIRICCRLSGVRCLPSLVVIADLLCLVPLRQVCSIRRYGAVV